MHVCRLHTKAANVDHPFVSVQEGLVAIPCHVVATDDDPGDQVLRSPEVQLHEAVIKIFFDIADVLIVEARSESVDGCGSLSRQPQHLVGVVDTHVREDTGAAVPGRLTDRIFENGDNLEEPANRPCIKELLGSHQRRIGTPHETDHDSLLMSFGVVQIAGEVDGRRDGVGQRLFEENALAGVDELAAMALVICRARGDNGGFTGTGCEQILDAVKGLDRFSLTSFCGQLYGDAIRRFTVFVDDGDELTHPGATRHLQNMPGMEDTHSPDSDDGDFYRRRCHYRR